jgi:hypothetical protein
MKCSSLKHSGRKTKILSLDDTRAHIGPKMWSPRLQLTGRAPKSPPSLRARHWATPNCHSSRNTQACLHTVKSTSKAWATKAQQGRPVNVAINSRLLACKGWNMISSILCQTHVKSVSLLSRFSFTQLWFHYLLSLTSYIQIIITNHIYSN